MRIQNTELFHLGFSINKRNEIRAVHAMIALEHKTWILADFSITEH